MWIIVNKAAIHRLPSQYGQNMEVHGSSMEIKNKLSENVKLGEVCIEGWKFGIGLE